MDLASPAVLQTSVYANGLSMYSVHQAHGGYYHRNNFETRLKCKRFEVLTIVYTRISLLGWYICTSILEKP